MPEVMARPATLKDQVYKELKKLLKSGRLDPVTMYSANQFAIDLGVSRTPVREALVQLATEGFLESFDGRGFKIRTFSEREIREIFESRQLIELYVVDRMASQPKEILSHLEKTTAAMKSCAREGDVAEFLREDEDFHMGLVRRYGNRLMIQVMENIRDCISLLGQKVLVKPERMAEVLAEHQRVVDAVRRGARAEAVKAMKFHLDRTEECLLKETP